MKARPVEGPYTLILGTNVISNCHPVLIIEGEEVLRVREDDREQLLLDCDMRGPDGDRVAKFVSNTAIVVGSAFTARIRPDAYEVIAKTSGQVVASVVRIRPRTVRITGAFCVDDCFIRVSDLGIHVGRTRFLIEGNVIDGLGMAPYFDRDSTAIGGAPAVTRERVPQVR